MAAVVQVEIAGPIAVEPPTEEWEKGGARFLTPQCADLLEDCKIDSEIRGHERPSDHVPVWVELAA